MKIKKSGEPHQQLGITSKRAKEITQQIDIVVDTEDLTIDRMFYTIMITIPKNEAEVAFTALTFGMVMGVNFAISDRQKLVKLKVDLKQGRRVD